MCRHEDYRLRRRHERLQTSQRELLRGSAANVARTLVRAVAVPGVNGKEWRTALLVGDPIQFGVSRQYQAFAEMYSNDAIFRDGTLLYGSKSID